MYYLHLLFSLVCLSSYNVRVPLIVVSNLKKKLFINQLIVLFSCKQQKLFSKLASPFRWLAHIKICQWEQLLLTNSSNSDDLNFFSFILLKSYVYTRIERCCIRIQSWNTIEFNIYKLSKTCNIG